MDFKDIIKTRRSALNLTLDDIGRHVGVSGATVSRWENGEIENIRRDKIAKLAEVLQVTPAYLMGWEESPTAPQSDSESPAFFRLRKGLEAYNISEADADYLVEMYKLHLKMNGQEQ